MLIVGLKGCEKVKNAQRGVNQGSSRTNTVGNFKNLDATVEEFR